MRDYSILVAGDRDSPLLGLGQMKTDKSWWFCSLVYNQERVVKGYQFWPQSGSDSPQKWDKLGWFFF